MTLSWSVSFFPQSGGYNIYHMTNNESKIIAQLYSDKSPAFLQSKYRYLSKPYDSTYISFIIMDIALNDAGYYASSSSAGNAWLSGVGVVLSVFGRFPFKLIAIQFFLS